jgi:hypothetical protein
MWHVNEHQKGADYIRRSNFGPSGIHPCRNEAFLRLDPRIQARPNAPSRPRFLFFNLSFLPLNTALVSALDQPKHPRVC